METLTFVQAVNRAIEIYKLQMNKNLLVAAIEADEEAGKIWSIVAIQQTAKKIMAKM